MRTKQEILEQLNQVPAMHINLDTGETTNLYPISKENVIIELLFDIRDLLAKDSNK